MQFDLYQTTNFGDPVLLRHVRVSFRRTIMTTLKTLTIVAALLAGGASLAIAQNGPATGGEHPVAGGAAGGPGYGHHHYRYRHYHHYGHRHY